jgi:hypothetical protein
MKSLEKMYIMHAYVYSVYVIMAVAPNYLIFTTSVKRQVEEGIF